MSVVRPLQGPQFSSWFNLQEKHYVHIATCFNLVSVVNVVVEMDEESPFGKEIFMEIKGVLLSNS